jgi:hypothetical protein
VTGTPTPADTVRPADEDVEAVRLGAWADDIVIGRFHVPHYANPGELKADVRAVLARLSVAVEGQAAAEQRAANAEKALWQIRLTATATYSGSSRLMAESARASFLRIANTADAALAAARAGEATEEKETAT